MTVWPCRLNHAAKHRKQPYGCKNRAVAWPFGTIFAIQITKNHIAKNMTPYPKLILDALATVTYAGTKKNLVESDMVATTSE